MQSVKINNKTEIFFLHNGAESLVDMWTWKQAITVHWAVSPSFLPCDMGDNRCLGAHESIHVKMLLCKYSLAKWSRAEIQEPEGLHSNPSSATYWPVDHGPLTHLLCASVSSSVRWESNSTQFIRSLWALNKLTFGKVLKGAWNIARFSYHGCKLQAASEMKGIIILISEIGIYPYAYLTESEINFLKKI